MARFCLLISNTSKGKAPIPASYRTRRSLNYALITGEERSCRKGRGWRGGSGRDARRAAAPSGTGRGSCKRLISARGPRAVPSYKALTRQFDAVTI